MNNRDEFFIGYAPPMPAGIARFIVALWPAITTATLFAGWSVYTSASERT